MGFLLLDNGNLLAVYFSEASDKILSMPLALRARKIAATCSACGMLPSVIMVWS